MSFMNFPIFVVGGVISIQTVEPSQMGTNSPRLARFLSRICFAFSVSSKWIGSASCVQYFNGTG